VRVNLCQIGSLVVKTKLGEDWLGDDQAKLGGRSISAEVIELLSREIPTEEELDRRRMAFESLLQLRAQQTPVTGPFQSTEEMLREDRER